MEFMSPAAFLAALGHPDCSLLRTYVCGNVLNNLTRDFTHRREITVPLSDATPGTRGRARALDGVNARLRVEITSTIVPTNSTIRVLRSTQLLSATTEAALIRVDGTIVLRFRALFAHIAIAVDEVSTS